MHEAAARAIAGRRCQAAYALLLVAAALPPLARAQRPVTAGDELTQAILRYAFTFEGGNVRLIPGLVPDDLAPNFYAPAGTRVLGTAVTPTTALVLATTTAPAESLRAEYARALAPRGWKVIEERDRGGFVGSVEETPFILCREGAHLYVRYGRRLTPPHDLHLHYREGAGMCSEPQVVRLQRMEGPVFPTLRAPPPPAGMRMSACYSRVRGPRSGSSTGTIVAAELSAEDVLRHYGRQLEASGWKAPGIGTTAALARGRWLRADSAGTSEVTLDVSEAAPGSRCYQVEMRISSP